MAAEARPPETPADAALQENDIATMYSLLSATERYIFRSGIGNLVAAALWTLTLFGAVIGIPLAIFGIYKLSTHARRSEMTPRAFAASARKIAILEVLLGGLGISGLIWGIIIWRRANLIRSICERHEIPA